MSINSLLALRSKTNFPEYLREPENSVCIRDAAQALLGRSFHIALKPIDAGSRNQWPPGPEPSPSNGPGALEEAQRQKNELKQAVIDIFGATPI
jgi:hypothetical protein